MILNIFFFGTTQKKRGNINTWDNSKKKFLTYRQQKAFLLNLSKKGIFTSTNIIIWKIIKELMGNKLVLVSHHIIVKYNIYPKVKKKMQCICVLHRLLHWWSIWIGPLVPHKEIVAQIHKYNKALDFTFPETPNSISSKKKNVTEFSTVKATGNETE